MRREMFNIKAKDLNLYLINCGYEDCCTRFMCAPHIRKYYLIHYIVKGTGYYEVNGIKHSLSAGDAFIIRPEEPVTYYSPDPNNTWSFCWFGFSGKDASVWLKECNIDKETYILHPQNPALLSIIMNCIDYMENYNTNLNQVKLTEYLAAALYSVSKQNKRKKINPASYADKAVKYIEYNYMCKISVSDIAMYLNIERSYFYRVFKKYTGSSPENYLIDYRIKKACELLKLKKYKVSEIASYVGIEDVYYFSRLFKKTVGVSPKKYIE